MLLQFDRIFGLNLGLLKKVQKQLKVPLKVKQLAEERLIARQNKDWKTADKIRQEVTDFGYVVEDTNEGYKFKKLDEVS